MTKRERAYHLRFLARSGFYGLIPSLPKNIIGYDLERDVFILSNQSLKIIYPTIYPKKYFDKIIL